MLVRDLNASERSPDLTAYTQKRDIILGGRGSKILGAPESLQMVTAAMKLKDAYSLKEKL